ncbi:hypothetical protein ACFBZI_08790 [Moraxella sp. ZJ142]|uniref:hypothetical protein n=1 Tax=Moraxella marmotae TaxID=3344520 RepID=UPI0035D4E374
MSVLTLNVKFKVKALQGLMAKGGGSKAISKQLADAQKEGEKLANTVEQSKKSLMDWNALTVERCEYKA